MGKDHSAIDDQMRQFIAEQHMFFVATAPLAAAGHVNCSPKGLDSFRVINDNSVAYVDFVGSGIETIAHIRENARIVIMFCAFQGPPKIVRLHGHGKVVEPHQPEFSNLLAMFPCASLPGVRAIITVEVTRVSDSCGYGVPLMTFESHRVQLAKWAEHKGPDGLDAYKREHNAHSIDGIEALSISR
jgi:hypothetical protein